MTYFLQALHDRSMKPRRRGWLALLAATLLLFCGHSTAQIIFSVTVTVDENGNGRITNTQGFNQALPFALQNDPGPGVLVNVLTYSLTLSNSLGLTAGDVFLQDGVGGLTQDIIRFNSDETCPDGTTGCLVFYSDISGGSDALGDIAGHPNAVYTNFVTLQETGTEGSSQGAIYTPVLGQPGFVTNNIVHYDLRSDVVPEPATNALLGLGLAGLGFSRRRKSN